MPVEVRIIGLRVNDPEGQAFLGTLLAVTKEYAITAVSPAVVMPTGIGCG
jgi:hypothetical protein